MAYECFDVSITDKVAHVKLDRGPNLNTMIPSFWSELPEIINEISDEGKARAIVISSTGKHFCAGMDLAVFTEGGLGEGGKTERGRRNALTRESALHLQESFTCFEKARMPVLVAIQGGCVGGAVDMVTAADMRYATEDAWFCIQEINIGMTADVGTLQRLPKIIPDSKMREMAYTGRRMYADEARETGLVSDTYESQEEMLAAANELAKVIASKSPVAIYGLKAVMNYSRDHSVNEGLEYNALWSGAMLSQKDMTEAITANMEKRDASFNDLVEVKKFNESDS